MLRTKSGLPKHCAWNLDRADGKRRVRFRKSGFSTYLKGIPWSEDFMREYAAALESVKGGLHLHIGAERTIAGTVNALIAAYLDPNSSSPFKTLGKETQRTRRCTLEAFRRAHGNKPLFQTVGTRRIMLLTREHVQRIVNEKTATPFAQHNLLKTLRAMFEWAVGEGRIHDNPALGVKRVKVKTPGYKSWSEAKIAAVNVPSRVVGVDGVGSDEMILRNSRDGRHFE